MTTLIGNVQDRFRTSTRALSMFAVRLGTGLVLGLTFALIGQEIVGYETISFVLVLLIVTGMLLRISRSWSWSHIFIFNLICVLIGLLLRMYILVAPNA